MMRILLLIGVFQAFFYAFLIMQKRKTVIHQYILAVWLIYLGLFIGVYAFYSEDLFSRFPHLINSYFSLLLLHGPFLYLYVKSLITEKNKIFDIRQLLHLVPFFLFNIYLFIAFQFSRIADNIQLDHVNSDVRLPLLYVFFLLIIVLSGPFYFIWTINMLRRHGIKILHKYSSIENINLSWLRNLIIIFGIIWTSLLFFAFVHHIMFLYTRDFCTNGLFISLSAFVLLIGYFGLKQSVIITADDYDVNVSMTKNKARYSGSFLQKDTFNRYLQKLENSMNIEKPFLEENLTIQQLADKLAIPSHHLSQVINEHYNQNFFDFINTYRIMEVKNKINDPKYNDYSLLGIALDSGFNSKTAFNRVFKKISGITPGEFKKQSIVK